MSSSSTSPSEWFHHFYNYPNATAPPPSTATLSSHSSDATVVSTTLTTNTSTTTTPTTSTNNHSLGQMGLSGLDQFLSTPVSGRSGQEARVSRSARRRSRASRKNPTTLLSTDTANFRAMVQRYTGCGASMTYSPLESASLGGFHQGQMGNFNHLHGSMPGVDLRASQLHQQLLMQQHGFASTANMSASSARRDEGLSSGISHVDPRSALQGSDHHLYSSSMGDENKRGGFMF